MENRNNTWSVACTIRAPQHITDAFLRHYASLNPEKIYLFFDDASMSDYDSSIAPGRVITFICDDHYWKNVPKIAPTKQPGVRPTGVEIRQHTNMLYAREIMSTDWLLHVDSDEILYAKKDVRSVLSKFPENVFSVCLKNYEAVYPRVIGVGEEFHTQYFKRYFPEKGILSKYYDEELISFSRGGFWGVETGKSFVRKGPEIFKMSVHRPIPLNPNLIANAKTNDLELLHFEGQSYELFKEKCLRRSRKKVATLMPDRFTKRLEKIESIISTDGERGLKELYKSFYVMDEDTLSSAISDGFVEEKPWRNKESTVIDYITGNNPLEEERSQRVSLWHGTVVRTFHNNYLAYDADELGITVANGYQLSRQGKFTPLEIQFIGEDKAVLFYKTFLNIYYVARSDTGVEHLSEHKQSATIFDVIYCSDTASAFFLKGVNGYLRVSPQGNVTFDSPEPLDWESLYAKVVHPQL
ncbi:MULTISPECIES: glycosyltransferase family 2 protein [Pseudomonas]|jgi:hypothetical protein|uniref:glycosyltransferase family 2 protein n=1 Tax=Pseudomonas TaxID=286 RepID=UPI0011B4B69E|nr:MULTISPECIES: glycosyltransferase family 2 protein [Pseudomonas]MBH3363692.1 hypothetical protein [Pseudomonas sp. URMO17WK12:I11]